MAVPTPDKVERQEAIREVRRIAKEVIAETQKYLDSEGYEVRMGAELNVFLEGKDGMPIKPESIDLTTAIDRQSYAPLVKRLNTMKDISGTGYTPLEFATQANMRGSKTSLKQWEPRYVADHIDGLKNHLNDLARSYGVHRVRLDAKPYPDMPDTCGMHINFSVWDKNGHNLFITPRVNVITKPEDAHTDRQKHIIASLLKFQTEGLLGFAPTKNSYARYTNYGDFAVLPDPAKLAICENASPNRIAVDNDRLELKRAVGKLSNLQQPPLSPSINVHTLTDAGMQVREYLKKPVLRAENCRIENRLPGADADPYVAVALTMAAIARGIMDYNKNRSFTGYTETLFPETHEQAKELLKNSELIKETFGEDFQKAAIAAYGSGQALPPIGRAAGR